MNITDALTHEHHFLLQFVKVELFYMLICGRMMEIVTLRLNMKCLIKDVAVIEM